VPCTPSSSRPWAEAEVEVEKEAAAAAAATEAVIVLAILGLLEVPAVTSAAVPISRSGSA
jgi:hypothetical protein